MEANDYFIMAIVSAIVFIGLLFASVQIIGESLTPQQSTYYAIIDSLGVVTLSLLVTLSLTIGFIVAGIAKKVVKRKRERTHSISVARVVLGLGLGVKFYPNPTLFYDYDYNSITLSLSLTDKDRQSPRGLQVQTISVQTANSAFSVK